ncbi:hypothetical protein TNCV_3861361 [Trichonephila clavipes]|nr:hypothetical protein TNCV_3861361 [Trichonephila clavipes]
MGCGSANLSSFWVLGAEDLQVPLALLEDQNLLPESLVKPSLSGPLGAHFKHPMDKRELEVRETFLHRNLIMDEKCVLNDNPKPKAQWLHKSKHVKQIPKPTSTHRKFSSPFDGLPKPYSPL